MARFTYVLASLAVCSTCADKAPLPDLDTVLTKATSKAHDFAEQAAAMQQRLQEQQEKSRAALAAQKKIFEQRLDYIQQQSSKIRAQNSELQAGNEVTERQNTVLFAELKEIQEKNGHMRATLQSLTEKVSAAQLFAVDSLKVTDDTQAEDLKVLAPTTPKPTLEHFLGVTSGRKVSLLAIGAKLREDPSELVSTLSNSLAEIKIAEEEGAAELNAQFMANMAEKQDRQAVLNATQAELLRTKAELEERCGKLLSAKAHLMATSKQLRDRLDGMRVFADKVDASVAATLAAQDTTNQPSNASAKNTPRPTVVAKATQLAVANQSSATTSNVTQAANASSVVAQKANTVVNQTSAVNQTVAAFRKAAATVVQMVHVATESVPKQAVPAQPALRKKPTVAQAIDWFNLR